VLAERRKTERIVRLNVVDIPALRLVGFCLVAVGVVLHNRFVFGITDGQAELDTIAILVGYAVGAWAALALGYRRVPRLDLVFLALDIVPLTYAIYASGGERSWLFFILVMRAADQTHASVKRALVFAHLTVAGYAALVMWLALVEHRAVPLGAEMAKLAFLYAANLYISLTAVASERRRRRLAATVRVARDLIRRLEEKSVQLEVARARAEAANEAKTQFLATMSHELRTPLNAIIGFSTVLRNGAYGALSDVQSEFVANILKAGRHLLQVVEDILTFSEAEAGRLTLQRTTVDAGALVHEAATEVDPLARQKAIVLTVDTGPRATAANADAAVLKQMVGHLLTNAIKFTPEGGTVTVTVDVDGDMLGIAVRDTGIGIKPEDQDRVFGAFEQVDSSYARAQQGAGLGLALTRRLAALHGGRIVLESSGMAGEGSTFTIEIPTASGGDRAPQAGTTER
jgi:signal transduction histidine kinase